MGSIRDNGAIEIFAIIILGGNRIDGIFGQNVLISLNADVVAQDCKFIVRLASNNVGIKVDADADVINEFDMADGYRVTNN